MKKPPLLTYGERLRYARELAGLSRAQLGKLLGTAATTIANVELRPGARSLRTLELARAIGVRPEWLDLGQEPMIAPFKPSAEAIELARQIEALPPKIRGMIQAMVLAYGNAATDERVEQFIKAAPKHKLTR